MISLSPQECTEPLQPAIWADVNRRLVAKALGEFTHERLLDPRRVQDGDGRTAYLLAADDPNIEYHFHASVLALDHWWVHPGSIRRYDRGREAPIDAERFITDLRARLAIPDSVLPEYLEEVSRTLFGAAYRRSAPSLPAQRLARAGFQTIEAAMTEGHPIFVANGARVGFNTEDHRAFAPEAAAQLRLVWLAARRERVQLDCIQGLTYEDLLRTELDAATLSAFESALAARGGDAASHVLLPVHPWQWENRIQQLFAGDLASGDLVHLGESADRYQPQQSIRTLFNLTRPDRCYVKTALSILNMGFTRGMPPSAGRQLMATNDWASRTVESDPVLRDCGFSLLREVAYVGYRHRHFEKASRARHEPYKEMLAALWRESPVPRLGARERLMTMAALLHVDADGASLLTSLIEASGLTADDWIRAYLRAYLRPLMHCFYAHGLTFTPHGENVILVLRDHAPARVFMKDIEDTGVLNPETPLPEEVRHLALAVPEDVMALVIFTDVFDCVLRFVAQILVEHASFPEERFWALVAESVHDYQASQPALADRFRRYDLFAPTFLLNCLNRLQLRNNRLMVDLNAPEPVDSLQFAGNLENPIAPFRDHTTGGTHGRA